MNALTVLIYYLYLAIFRPQFHHLIIKQFEQELFKNHGDKITAIEIRYGD